MLANMSITQTRHAGSGSSDETVSFGFTDVAREEKASLVRGVFDRSARRYDLMNDLMSLGIHRVWKDMVMTRANPQPGELHIDVAGGTGDLARSFLAKADAVAERRGSDRKASAIVLDINEQMLRAGVKRGLKPHEQGRIDWVTGNAECLPLPDRTRHARTCGCHSQHIAGACAGRRSPRADLVERRADAPKPVAAS